MNVTDEALQKAASLVRSAELAQWSDFELYPTPPFSEKFEAEMQELIRRVRNGEIRQKKAKLGWQYYTGRGIAAILLCFLLTFAAMPEAVMASCQRIIEMVKTVLPEYTEYQLHSNAANEEFVPLKITYMPEFLNKTEFEEHNNEIYMSYESNGFYFSLNQTLLNKNNTVSCIIDTEDVEPEKILVQGEEVDFIFRHDDYKFIWLHDDYLIAGQSNLEKEEVIQILNNIKFGN